MNIRLFKIRATGGPQAGKARLQRRSLVNDNRFLIKCLDLVNSYEAIQLGYKRLFDKDTLFTMTEAAYREKFTGMMQRNKELLRTYGRHIDHFINSTLDIEQLPAAQKICFERTMDVYLMMQKEYMITERLYKLPFRIQEGPAENKVLADTPARPD